MLFHRFPQNFCSRFKPLLDFGILFEGDNPYESLYWPPLWESVIGSMFLSRVRKVVWEPNLAYSWEFVEELIVEGRLQDCLLEVFWDPNPWNLSGCRVCFVITGCWVILTLVMGCRVGKTISFRFFKGFHSEELFWKRLALCFSREAGRRRDCTCVCVCVCVRVRSWLFVTPWTAACQAPLSMGIFQARILEWIAMPSSRGSSKPRDRTQVSHFAGNFTNWATREAFVYSK